MDSNSLPYILSAVALLGFCVWNLWVSVWVNPEAEKRVAALRDSPREIREAFLHHTIVQSRLARANHLTLVLILLLLVVLALK
jgi:hypothetical protein